MDYLCRVFTWFILSILWGAAGVAVGPGVVMLIISLLVAICGCFYSLGEKIFDCQLSIFWSGLIVSVVTLFITLVVFGSFSLGANGYIFLTLFILIPSYLILFVVKKYHN